MRLHENKQLFKQAVEFTAQEKQILPIYVEKDYWVTYAFHTIFKHKIGEETLATLQQIRKRLSTVEWTIKNE